MISVWPSTVAHYCAVRTANTLTADMDHQNGRHGQIFPFREVQSKKYLVIVGRHIRDRSLLTSTKT